MLWFVVVFQGHITSYYGAELQKYTSFQGHHSEVRHFVANDRGILSLSSDKICFSARQGLRHFNLRYCNHHYCWPTINAAIMWSFWGRGEDIQTFYRCKVWHGWNSQGLSGRLGFSELSYKWQGFCQCTICAISWVCKSWLKVMRSCNFYSMSFLLIWYKDSLPWLIPNRTRKKKPKEHDLTVAGVTLLCCFNPSSNMTPLGVSGTNTDSYSVCVAAMKTCQICSACFQKTIQVCWLLATRI